MITKHILIADDHPIFLNSLGDFCKEKKYLHLLGF
jgi:hypothetical protein